MKSRLTRLIFKKNREKNRDNIIMTEKHTFLNQFITK